MHGEVDANQIAPGHITDRDIPKPFAAPEGDLRLVGDLDLAPRQRAQEHREQRLRRDALLGLGGAE